jgi:hypothetical protein
MEQRITGRNSYGLGAQGIMFGARYRRNVHMLYVTPICEDISRKTRVLIPYKYHFNNHRTWTVSSTHPTPSAVAAPAPPPARKAGAPRNQAGSAQLGVEPRQRRALFRVLKTTISLAMLNSLLCEL